MYYPKIIFAALAVTTAIAHPGPDHPVPHAEIQRRNELAKKCASQAANFNQRRISKRALQKRWEGSGRNVTYEITTGAPHYETIQNDTCVLSPEVTRGPYVWPRSQTLRQDMSEDQPGVPLWLDVGVLDMATCEPLPNVLLDFWHCNATGSYSSFTHLSPNIEFRELLAEKNLTDYAIGVTDLHTDDTTFLRGMWPTDENGVMEIKTIFPAVSQQIMGLEPYVFHTEIDRITNAQDAIYQNGTKGGFNPVVSIVPADGKDISKGMIGYITMGVDTAAIETFEYDH
ncbi:Intradiol ring-cleavage dioxygenase [Aspergillus minisclerotigenes]|uniref:Intradiol ring-cleavage dioxygenase n=1 Tax=Aspergillus minisclerotigenes TaxID=656917 RepID=A0A5N6JBD4_9EURO|nr:Intradiol ring-cleavage dioxygenase [Aspergillus minisclerotigenes]